MKREVKIAAIAPATIDGMVKANYLRVTRLVEIALMYSPDIVLLPEAFAAGYCGQELLKLAESRKSNYLKRFRDLSRIGRCMILVGYLEKSGRQLRNAVVIYDSGKKVGVHYKRTLWPDAKRDYRDEQTLMAPGKKMEVFRTRFGRMGVVICYENMVEKDWAEVAPKVDFILSPYNCEADPAGVNIKKSRKYRIPSAWANRVGMVWAGPKGFQINVGSAGMVDARGRLIAKSTPAVEEIVVGAIRVVSGKHSRKRD